MYIRPAEQSDLPLLATIGAAAFVSDVIYRHFHPFRDIFPQDFQNSFLNTLRRFMVTPGAVIMVAELDRAKLTENEHAKEGNSAGPSLQGKKIIGYIVLIRYGSEKSVAAWNPDSNEKRK